MRKFIFAALIAICRCNAAATPGDDVIQLLTVDENESTVIAALDLWNINALPERVSVVFIPGSGGLPAFAALDVDENLNLRKAVIYFRPEVVARLNLDAVAVMGHEIGHVHGFRHADSQDSIMYPVYYAVIPSVEDLKLMSLMLENPDTALLTGRFLCRVR